MFKTSSSSLIAVVLFAVALHSEGGIPLSDAATSVETFIPGPISDGAPSAPEPRPVLPDFVVKSTVVRRVDVVEAPPMSGLPPVTGTITQTVHLVEDPKLPDPPPPLPPVSVDDPLVLAQLAEMSAKYRETRLVFLSATVYDHSRTLLHCYPSGNARKEITAWSNLDFNHFGGFASFEAKGDDGEVRKYGLLMGIGNMDTKQWAEFVTKHEVEYKLPEIPVLPDGDPAYKVVSEAPDKEGMELIEDLHALYRVEGQRMEDAYHARLKAEAERRTYLLANPPKPEDVTVHFWQRDHPVGMAADSIKQGGGN